MLATEHQIATCGRCLDTKTAMDFYRDSSARSGLRTVCKACDAATRVRLLYKIEFNDLWLAQRCNVVLGRVESQQHSRLRKLARDYLALRAAHA
jgi:hypothetical protein